MVCKENCDWWRSLGVDSFGRPLKDPPKAVGGSIVFSHNGDKLASIVDTQAHPELQPRTTHPWGWIPS